MTDTSADPVRIPMPASGPGSVVIPFGGAPLVIIAPPVMPPTDPVPLPGGGMTGPVVVDLTSEVPAPYIPLPTPDPLDTERAQRIQGDANLLSMIEAETQRAMTAEGVGGFSIAGASDVAVSSPQPGDMLKFGAGSKWVNDPVVDGGNF